MQKAGKTKYTKNKQVHPVVSAGKIADRRLISEVVKSSMPRVKSVKRKKYIQPQLFVEAVNVGPGIGGLISTLKHTADFTASLQIGDAIKVEFSEGSNILGVVTISDAPPQHQLTTLKEKSYKCQIIQVKPSYILADVLVDEKKGDTRIQKFDQEQIAGVFDPEEGNVFIMKEQLLQNREGQKQKVITYSKGAAADEVIFEKLDAITDPINDKFFKLLPNTTAEDNF